MRLAGIDLQNPFPECPAAIQIRLFIHPLVCFRDHARQALPLPLFHIELKRWKNTWLGYFCRYCLQIASADSKLSAESARCASSSEFFMRVVFGMDLVIETLITAAAAGVGLGLIPIHRDQNFQLGHAPR